MLMLNGETVPPGMASRLNALSLRLEAMGFPAIGVASGVRSKATQEAIFRARYLPVAVAGGRNPYNDKRYWQGQWWVRVQAGGTVLPPGSSTHEDPPGTGVDLAWPYNNRYTAAHAALVSICEEYGIRWTGKDFVGGGEDWHFDDIWNPYGTFASTGATPFEEDDLDANQAAQLDALYKAVIKPYGSQIDAAIDVVRGETGGAIASIAAGQIYFPGAGYLLGPALANGNAAVLAAIAQLAAVVDPDKDGSAGVDVGKLILESEQRTKDFYEQQLTAQVTTLRQVLVDTLSTTAGLTKETVAEGVDLALSRAFPVRTMPATSPAPN